MIRSETKCYGRGLSNCSCVWYSIDCLSFVIVFLLLRTCSFYHSGVVLGVKLISGVVVGVNCVRF